MFHVFLSLISFYEKENEFYTVTFIFKIAEHHKTSKTIHQFVFKEKP